MKYCTKCGNEIISDNMFCTKCGNKVEANINEVVFDYGSPNNKCFKSIIISIINVIRYILFVFICLLAIVSFFYNTLLGIFFVLFGLSLAPFVYKKIYITSLQVLIPILILVIAFFAMSIINMPEKPNIIDSNSNSDVVVFENNIEKIFNDLNMDSSKIDNILKISDWAHGPRYTFWYDNNIYYVYAFESGQVLNISINSAVGYKIYNNDNIVLDYDTSKLPDDAIILDDGKLGEYGKYDKFGEYEHIRYYVPAGTYEVVSLMKGSMIFVDKKRIVKNSSGYYEAVVVYQSRILNVDDTDTIVVKNDCCITIIDYSVVALIKK